MTEAFCGYWYVCPHCQTENTVRTSNNPYIKKGFSCKNCKDKWTIGDLCEIYGFKTNLIKECLEFYCEKCEEVNQAYGHYEAMVMHDEDQEFLVDVYKDPTESVCKKCQTMQNLVIPIDEKAEEYIKQAENFKPESMLTYDPFVFQEITPEEEEMWEEEAQAEAEEEEED